MILDYYGSNYQNENFKWEVGSGSTSIVYIIAEYNLVSVLLRKIK